MVGVMLLVLEILVLGMIAMVGRRQPEDRSRDPSHSGSW